jgi:Transposase, Mutator family
MASASAYARRSKSLEVLIPVLYLKGISTGDFAEALSALLGPNAGGLSASTIARLKEVWADEHARWLKRDLSAKRVCDRSASDDEIEGLPLKQDRVHHDLQARPSR